MKIQIVSFGHKRDALFRDALGEYQKRIQRPWALEFIDLPSGRQSDSEPTATVMTREARALAAQGIAPSSAWALTLGGEMLTSEALAKWLEGAQNAGVKTLSLIIGGADGLDPGLERACAKRLSLSRLTFAHRLARVVLAEQLYRAQSILRGDRYHK